VKSKKTVVSKKKSSVIAATPIPDISKAPRLKYNERKHGKLSAKEAAVKLVYTKLLDLSKEATDGDILYVSPGTNRLTAKRCEKVRVQIAKTTARLTNRLYKFLVKKGILPVLPS